MVQKLLNIEKKNHYKYNKINLGNLGCALGIVGKALNE
jgi:hypothetical protein